MPSTVASVAAVLISTAAPFLLTFGTLVNYERMTALSTNKSSNNFSSWAAVPTSIFHLNYSASHHHLYLKRSAQSYYHHRHRRWNHDHDGSGDVEVETQAEDIETFDEARVAALATLGAEAGRGSSNEYITAHNKTFKSSIKTGNGGGSEPFKIPLQLPFFLENETLNGFISNNSTGNASVPEDNGKGGDETHKLGEFNLGHDVVIGRDPMTRHHVHEPITTSEPGTITDDKGNENVFYHPPRATINFTTIFLVLMFSILFLLTLIGNGLVCLSLTFVKKLRKPQNYLIASLALSDLFVALFVMPFAIVLEIYEGQWPFDKGLCDFWVSGKNIV
ncbi:5-hydroxytryptamine receptor 1 [Orchesella cincta]|uniref:5-hydroxytryptamine receptor 1 n=1 Tax=Orchesella cincta TaxID=48709 RepID=A0A1D2NI33_ORCCI|nr:5-hydroxytryptamine receptor 1 [Orchesella cincta]